MPKDFMVCCGIAAVIILAFVFFDKFLLPIFMWLLVLVVFGFLILLGGFILYILWMLISGQGDSLDFL